MSADSTLELACKLYPELAGVSPPVTSLPAQCGPVSVPAGTVLFNEGSPCMGFPLVLEGEVKVSRLSQDGRSLELYRVVPGELCLISSACLFRQHALSAHGCATRDTQLLLIPPHIFQQWMESLAFRNEVLGLFAERMSDFTALVDAVAFHRLDVRLADALLGQGEVLHVTHQALADRLGTVREIVTRLLKRFEQDGWVELAREQIRILDSTALREHARALHD